MLGHGRVPRRRSEPRLQMRWRHGYWQVMSLPPQTQDPFPFHGPDAHWRSFAWRVRRPLLCAGGHPPFAGKNQPRVRILPAVLRLFRDICGPGL